MRGKSRDRTRPDESGKPSYITREGYRRLEEQAGRLWNHERPRVAKAVAIAAAEGDRSENAEYIYGKRKLAEIDRKLAWLGKRLDVLTIVDQRPDDEARIFFGAWVRLEDEHGKEVTYRIVGPDEADAEAGWISVQSPVAKALLKKEEGDEVLVQSPKGRRTYEIIEVSYSGPPRTAL